MKLTFDSKYNHNSNSMDIIRLFLAIVVIYGHTFPVLYGPSLRSPTGKFDMLAMFSNNQMGSGTVAVYMFFIISGFLITQSLSNSGSYVEYITKRALRILPALFFSLVLAIFVIGSIVTNLSASEYFQSSDPYLYFANNLFFGIFGFHYSLNDVFSTNPFPSSINASMWTLPHEVACYLLILLFSFFNFFRKRELMAFIFVVSSIIVYYNVRFGYTPIKVSDNFWVFGTANLSRFIVLSFYFLAGSIIYLYKDKIVYKKSVFFILLVILLLTARFGYFKYSLLICLPYVTMFIGMIKPFVDLRKIGDFSYGAYIYAFPIQQLLVYYLGNKLSFIPFLLLSTFCILCVSVISWYFIEKPALSLKKRLRGNYQSTHVIKNSKTTSA